MSMLSKYNLKLKVDSLVATATAASASALAASVCFTAAAMTSAGD